MKESGAHDLKTRLEASRKELLDLTFRNPLLNYRPLRARGVQVVDVTPAAVFDALVRSGRKLTFKAAEPPVSAEARTPAAPVQSELPLDATEEPSPVAPESAFDAYFTNEDSLFAGEVGPIASENGDDFPADMTASKSVAEKVLPSAPVAESSAREPAATRRETTLHVLPTAAQPADLQKRLLNTLQTARSFIEEQGVNTLFIALGFLIWYDDEARAEDAPRRSPLLLIPVELERTMAGERFTLRYTEEEIAGNISLATLLRTQYGVELPAVEGDELDVRIYLEQVALIIAGKPRWSVDTGAVALAFFSFNKYLMYRELEDAVWPEGQQPTGKPILAALLGGGFSEPEPTFAEDSDLDAAIPLGASRTIVDADSSQVLAIEDVKSGRTLVIQGPPGTGKSQTITNIIAEAIGLKRRVLFVSEKLAALEVVKQRLDAQGLGDACLELHSNKTHKKAVLEELKRSLAQGDARPGTDPAEDIALLGSARDRLNAYCAAINAPVGRSGRTLHDLFGEWLQSEEHYRDTPLPHVDLPDACLSWSSTEFREREQAVRELQAHVAQMGLPRGHPYWGSGLTAYVATEAETFRHTFAEAAKATANLRASAAILAEKLGIRAAPDFSGEADALAAATLRAIEAPVHEGMQFPSGLWQARRREIEQLLDLGAHLTDLHTRFDSIVQPEAWEHDLTVTRQSIAEYAGKWWHVLAGPWRAAQRDMRLVCRATPPPEPQRQLEILDTLIDAHRTLAAFQERSGLGATLYGAQWQGIRSDWPVLRQLLQWILEMHAAVGSGLLPRAFLDFLSGGGQLQLLRADALAVQAAVRVQAAAQTKATDILRFNAADVPSAAVPLAEQETRYQRWSENVSRLGQIGVFNHLAKRLQEWDLQSVIETASAETQAAALLEPAFRRAWLLALLRHAFGANVGLANFSGPTHEEIVKQFRLLDERLLRYNCEGLAAQHRQALGRIASLGPGNGQLRVLTREFEKKSRFLPLRTLLERAGNAVQTIKPVFMMSPLSVATFLAPGGPGFDLVIFDEASQVKPVDALGALLRAPQAVVVGDSRQLPPTNFFESLTQAEGGTEDESSETADMESILGLFVGQGAPQRMLRWHYRSRHESLIAVSNQLFYDGRLVIFPSPDGARERLGLLYHHLPDTVYDRGASGTNRLEAIAVARAVMAHARAQILLPEAEWQTLGVAAFSMGQMQAISDQLEILRREALECEPFFRPSRREPFFVKNLENVQGDERDVMYISIGYGRDRDGRVAMNFGPLNGQGGERRLNVLISRARLRCEVFTNLTPDDIDLQRASASGVAALKTFLAYARSGDLSTAGSAPVEGNRPFEAEIAATLTAHGYTVVRNVGCAGYFVDLAIVDPARPGRYILGIECDGAVYRSAQSARDRDRLRGEVLRRMGWRLQRVWSTDWINARADAEARLIAAVESALSDSVRADAAIEEAARSEAAAVAMGDDAPSSATRESEPSQPKPLVATPPSDTEPPNAYVVARLRPLSGMSINDLSYESVAEMAAQVVLVESPVHIEDVARRIADSLAAGRITDRFHTAVERACDIAARQGAMRRAGDFLWNAQMSDVPLRNRSALEARQRDITRVAPEELRLAIVQAVADSFGLPAVDIPASAGRLLGFARVTGEIRAAFEAQLIGMIAEGICHRANDGMVTLPPGARLSPTI